MKKIFFALIIAMCTGFSVFATTTDIPSNASESTCSVGVLGVESGSVEFDAKWTAYTCTVTFKTGNTTLGTQNFTYGTAQNLTALTSLPNYSSATIPAAANGWSFYGWAKNVAPSDGSGLFIPLDPTINYTNGQSVSDICTQNGGNITLYAVWKRDFSFVYYSDDLSDFTTSTSTQSYGNVTTTTAGISAFDTPYLQDPSNSWIPQGFVLNSTSSTTVTVSLPGGGYTSVTPAMNVGSTTNTYYALYARDTVIKYRDNNGATGSVENTTGATQYYNAGGSSATAVSITLAQNGFSKEGHTFAGWVVEGTSTPIYSPGTSYSMPTTWNSGEGMTMNPSWNQCAACTPGAHCGTCTLTVSNNTCTYTISGPDAGYTVTPASSGTSAPVCNANTNTPYVVNHYTINSNNSSYTLSDTQNLTGTTDTTLTLSTLAKSISGFTYNSGFAGTTTNGTTKPQSGAVTTATISGDGTLVIDLYYNRTLYPITIVAGNGITSAHFDDGEQSTTKSAEYGSVIDLDTVIVSTLKTGYTGTTYAITSGAGTLSGSTFTVGAGATEITVSATGIDAPTVKWSGNGSSALDGNSFTSRTYNYQDKTLYAVNQTTYDSGITVYYKFSDPSTTDSSYTYTGNSFTTTNSLTVAKDAYLGSRYYKIQAYATDGTLTSSTSTSQYFYRCELRQPSISFNATTNGGTLSGTSPLYIRYNDGNLYDGVYSNTTASVPTATKANATFNGWYTSATDGLQIYNANGVLQQNKSGYTSNTNPAKWRFTSSGKTLHAQFTCNTGYYLNTTTQACDEIVVTTPTNHLTYNGSAQNCPGITVTTPSSGTTVQYATKTNGTCGTFGNSVPTITNAGSTEVCYQVTANGGSKTSSYTCYMDKADCGLTLKTASNGTVLTTPYAGSTTYPNNKTIYATTNSACTLSVANCLVANASVPANVSSGTITMTPTSAGTDGVIITATGDSNYNVSNAEYALTVNRGTIACSNTASGCGNKSWSYDTNSHSCGITSVITPDTTVQYAVKTGNSCSGVTYSSTVPTVTSVADSKTICYKITKTNYNDKTGEFNCNITKANGEPVIRDDSNNIVNSEVVDTRYPDTRTFSVTCPESGTLTSASSEDTSTATVSTSGSSITVTPVAYNATDPHITVNCGATANYNASSAEFKIHVIRGRCFITLTPSSGTITYPTTTATFNIDWGDCNGQKDIVSANSNKATAAFNTGNNSATVTWQGAGATTITVISVESDQYDESTAEYTVTTQNGTISATASNNSKTYDGNALTCNGNINVTAPDSGYTVQYATKTGDTCGSFSSTAPTRTDAGTTNVCYKITANNYTNKTGEFTCTVNPKECPITLSATSGSTTFPNTKTFTASTDSGCSLSASPTRPGPGIKATASISNGTVTMTPVAYGSQDISVSATATDNNHTDSSTPATYRLSINNGTISANVSDNSKTYDGNALTCNGNINVTAPDSDYTVQYATKTGNTCDSFSSTVPTVTNVADSKTICYRIIANNYNEERGEFTCTVNKADCTLTFDNFSATLSDNTLTYPEANGAFKVVGNAGTISVSSGNTAKVTTSFDGTALITLTPVASHSSTIPITVTSAESGNYNSCSAVYNVSINDKTITLNSNGGSGTCNGGSMTCSYASNTCTAPTWNSSTCNITKSNSTLKFWGTAANGSGDNFVLGDDISNVGNTLYAQWSNCGCNESTGVEASSCTITVTNNRCNATWTCADGSYNPNKSATWDGGTHTVTCISCSALTPAPSVSGGTYSSVSPRSAETDCKYTINCSLPTNCATVTSNTISFVKNSGWGTNYCTVTAPTGYSISNNNTANPSCSANSIGLTWYQENGTTQYTVPSTSQTCVYDTGINLPDDPTKTGYQFTGWEVMP